MENKKPIKRHEALKPLSREHHHGLLLCWKIRQGIKFEVEPGRMKNYTDWFKQEYLYPHFEAEEEFVFPVLGNEHDLVKKALAEHRRLKRLFNKKSEIIKALTLIEEELDRHIRFEERILFNEVQKNASPEQFEEIEEKHHAIAFSDDDWDDHFGKKKRIEMENALLESDLLGPVSTEHRHALQLCDNIRKGLRKNVHKERIRSYTDWYKKNYLDPHFELEERHIFPLLGNNVRVRKAMANHRRINKLLSCDCDNERVLNLLEEELRTYIKFEERVLYKEIAEKATAKDLALLLQHHENINFSEDEWKDKFWIS